ncbi:MAG: hypothetical protein ABJB74_16525 [Gemmatimonas sp.]
MANATNRDLSPDSKASADETNRVRDQLAARLLNRGVRVHTQDTPDALGTLTESVESFEAAVEARGGDLMMDEPPAGRRAQPDNPAFVLPTRASNETAHSYSSRIDALTAKLRA